jgi:hypothetical protein
MSSGIPAKSAAALEVPTEISCLPNGNLGSGHVNLQGTGVDDLEDHPVENFRKMKVIIIGAGFSGIYMGKYYDMPTKETSCQPVQRHQNTGMAPER